MEVVFGTAQSIMVMQQGRTIIQGDPQAVRQNVAVRQAYLGDE
jgi:ABC-type branched-subunit amino acid transport system ATPase component